MFGFVGDWKMSFIESSRGLAIPLHGRAHLGNLAGGSVKGGFSQPGISGWHFSSPSQRSTTASHRTWKVHFCGRGVGDSFSLPVGLHQFSRTAEVNFPKNSSKHKPWHVSSIIWERILIPSNGFLPVTARSFNRELQLQAVLSRSVPLIRKYPRRLSRLSRIYSLGNMRSGKNPLRTFDSDALQRQRID